MHWHDLFLSRYFYIAYVKGINIFRRSLLPQMEENGEVLENSYDFIALIVCW